MEILLCFLAGVLFYNNIMPILNRLTSTIIDLLDSNDKPQENKKKPIGFKAKEEDNDLLCL